MLTGKLIDFFPVFCFRIGRGFTLLPFQFFYYVFDIAIVGGNPSSLIL